MVPYISTWLESLMNRFGVFRRAVLSVNVQSVKLIKAADDTISRPLPMDFCPEIQAWFLSNFTLSKIPESRTWKTCPIEFLSSAWLLVKREFFMIKLESPEILKTPFWMARLFVNRESEMLINELSLTWKTPLSSALILVNVELLIMTELSTNTRMAPAVPDCISTK